MAISFEEKTEIDELNPHVAFIKLIEGLQSQNRWQVNIEDKYNKDESRSRSINRKKEM